MTYEKYCRNCEHAYLTSCKGCNTLGDNKYQNFELREELAEKDVSDRALELESKYLSSLSICPKIAGKRLCDRYVCCVEESTICWKEYFAQQAKQELEKEQNT